MEEQVGQFWHSLITRLARTDHPAAAVSLEDVRRAAGVMFRALGGDGGLRIEAATKTDYRIRRSFLQRVAGSNQQVELAWRDRETLRLPESIAVFSEKSLNRELYLWLAALASRKSVFADDWFWNNQIAARSLLEQFPGLQARYNRLVQESFKYRPDPEKLSADDAAHELAIRNALLKPGSIRNLPETKQAGYPVWLWLHPNPPLRQTVKRPENNSLNNQENGENKTSSAQIKKKKKGEYTDDKKDKSGLLAFRLESLFTRAEHVKVDRTTDEEEDLSKAQDALEDMDKISVADSEKKSAVTLRFDLDLPSQEQDDTQLEGELLLSEWDWKRGELLHDYCRLQPMLAEDVVPVELPVHLQRSARKLCQQFESLAPVRSWHRGQADGNEIDMDAWLRHVTDNMTGHAQSDTGLYRDFRGGNRDLACLLLADLSLSTDAWVNNSARIIDIIRDSLFLFSEALTHTGDRFAMYGFSSRSREHIRFHHIKTFAQKHDNDVRGRIQAIKPGYYTRMGAAIRHASSILSKEVNSQRLLLLLTDGKPNDLDHYEGRYGVEDTRHAVQEARKEGLQVFCVTIDEQAEDYLPHLFGAHHYVLIRHAADLPNELPLLYMRITQDS